MDKVRAKKNITPKAANVRVRKHTKRDPIIAEGTYCFWVAHGPVLADLRDLAGALASITDEQFFHHVTGDRNDFSLWVMEVLRDEETARALAKTKSKGAAHKVVTKAIKGYSW